MCGIVGYVGKGDALSVIVSGLERLEYRGYDSAGVAVLDGGQVTIRRALGKLSELKKQLHAQPLEQQPHVGIGHTRWATHGRPSENNAHPHRAGRVSLIHNGIIENYVELRERLQSSGVQFASDTDTETAAHLCDQYLKQGLSLIDALKRTCRDIRGSYAFLAIDSENPDRIAVAKNSTPIVLGLGDGEQVIASDIPAVLGVTRRVVILEDGDFAEVWADGYRLWHGDEEISREELNITWDPVTAQKGGYKHFMLKEIHEQGRVIADTLRGRMDIERGQVLLPELDELDMSPAVLQRVQIVACGTAWHAGLVGKFFLESIARVPCEVDYASEYRYRTPLADDCTLVAAISQSGETADTLAALELASKSARTLAICNVLGSTLTRRAQYVVYTHAGPEISVASTKAFTTQLVALYLFALRCAAARGVIGEAETRQALQDLSKLPAAIEQALEGAELVERTAKQIYHARDVLFLGRGSCYPVALEGALKMKEISYIHAEGYPAGEMKHGPIALIDEKVPVVVILPREEVAFEKTLSNLREVESRGGRIVVVTDSANTGELSKLASAVLQVPFVSHQLSPILLTIPLQLLSYHTAVLNGTDVDLPRNLAKSVTVE